MDKEIIEYCIPIQSQKHVDEWNEKYSKKFVRLCKWEIFGKLKNTIDKFRSNCYNIIVL